MTRVSIFMSSFNHAPFLRGAIRSVLDQTYSDFELFILDDASSDESWNIVESFDDQRIHALRNPVNRNDKQEMKRILQQLTAGEFIAVHHSDNLWEPDKLQQQVDLLDAQPQVGAVFTHAMIIDEHGQPLTDHAHFYHRIFEQPNRSRHAWLNHFFYQGNALCHPSVLIRRKCYDQCGYYRNGFGQIPDLDLWVRLCLKYEIHVLPHKLVRFRVPSDQSNISGSRPATRVRYNFEFLQVLDHYRSLSTFEDLLQVFPDAEAYRRPAGSDPGYVLGRLALDARVTSPAMQLFGLNLLFEALGDPVRAIRIAELYGFTHKDFLALTGQRAAFAVEGVRGDIGEIWRIAGFLTRLREALFPAGSIQYRLLQAAYRRWMLNRRSL